MPQRVKSYFPVDRRNEAVSHPEFGRNMQKLLQELKAEAVYFCPVKGQRGGCIVVNLDDTSKPVWEGRCEMLPEDLAEAAPDIRAAA